MKGLKQAFNVLTILTGVGALVMLIFKMFKIDTLDSSFSINGLQAAFGAKDFAVGSATYNVGRSAWLLFALIFVLIGIVSSIISLKKKGGWYGSVICYGVAGLFTLIRSLIMGGAGAFVDVTEINIKQNEYSNVSYNSAGYIFIGILLAGFVISVIGLVVADYLECKNSQKLFLTKRIGKFFREYKSEVKKIVWPTFPAVVKNTVIVLIMCVVVGAFIWLLDWGLSSLLNWLLSL